MIRGEFQDAGDRSPEALRAAYERRLAEAVEAVGSDRVVDETDLDGETVEALRSFDGPDLTLTDAASILALERGAPPAETIAAEARDVLLLGMTTAVLDVESLASEIGGPLEPKEIQQKVEGRQPITLAEYALLHHHLEART